MYLDFFFWDVLNVSYRERLREVELVGEVEIVYEKEVESC